MQYALMKEKYLQFVNHKRKQLELPSLETREGIELHIQGILDGSINKTNHQVVQKKETNVLMAKKGSQLKQIIGMEDAFDLILKAHIDSDHGNKAETLVLINNHYIVPQCCVNSVLGLCNVCAKQSIRPIKSYSRMYNNALSSTCDTGKFVWRVQLIEMRNITSSFSSLLLMVEDSTNFFIMRPVTVESEQTAMEMMKVFLEYGPPKKMLIPDGLLFYMNIVRTFLSPIMPNWDMEVYCRRHDIFQTEKQLVIDLLESWQESASTERWDIGCHIVQFELNNTKRKITIIDKRKTITKFTKESPFELMYGKSLNKSI